MSFFTLPQTRQKACWTHLHGDAMALCVAEYCSQHKGITLLISPDNVTSKRMETALAFFLDNTLHDIMIFPDWETLPYDLFSPHQDIISDRLTTLSRLAYADNLLVICTISTLLQRLCPPEFLHQHALVIKTGDTINLTQYTEQLVQAGYYSTQEVSEHGEFAVRGAILDLFPMGQNAPVRIELFDNTIDTIRIFDPETQRTTQKMDRCTILPAREFPLHDTAIRQFRQAFRAYFPGDPTRHPLYEAISDKRCPGGIEYYLPLFFTKTASFFDYIPDNARVFYVDNIPDDALRCWQDIQTRYEHNHLLRPLMKPEDLFITPNTLLQKANQYHPIRLTTSHLEKKGAVYTFPTESPPSLPIQRNHAMPFSALAQRMQEIPKKRLLVAESLGRREVLITLLQQSGIRAQIVSDWQDFLRTTTPLCITVGPLEMGAVLETIEILVESQFFGEQYTPTRKKQTKSLDPDRIIRDLVELTIGSPVVHIQFGVGRYLGLETLEMDGIANEFLKIAYAREDKIYVPVTALHQISRYTGSDSTHAPLHALGSDQFTREKKKAEEKIHDVAIELLDIYAKRAAKEGTAMPCAELDFLEFASAFPFSETEDQTRAIAAIRDDMAAPRPMDRLICGDVGFGKTEVAMRAAFIAVQNHKQVAVLVPTTLLAQQHEETFRTRFADVPVTIALLSRFKSSKESTHITQDLGQGKIDIIIGTHKLFSEKVHFKNLGLLIIDEEHRFGVKQKEYIKKMRASIDILSMTATPIPRTLNMAMSGLRDISLIATPPAKRRAIKTFWYEHSDSLIREAVLREIFRGGQIYYLHNDVKSIQDTAQKLRVLIPEAKIEVGHGQMPERMLERVMSDFYHHRFQILVCSTIIETGIDIPSANTIIIDRADKFGLAQLHQLRGRVGRSHHQAYAYLFTPNKTLVTPDAQKRLDAIVALEDLGAGFTLASHDLEIRGAGELLGEEQSGNMHAIGFTLYMEMLEQAVTDLRAGKTPDLAKPFQSGTEIDLKLSAILPENYIHDINTRLTFYKRIAHAPNHIVLETLEAELIDRFGLLPPSVHNLFQITALKQKAETMGIKKITTLGDRGKLHFNDAPKINLGILLQWIQVHPKRYQLEGRTALRFTFDNPPGTERIAEVAWLLDKLRVPE